jgi:acyl-homoserine-lactone acylase
VRKTNKAYAVRVAGLKTVHIIPSIMKWVKLKNMKEFEDALKMMQIPSVQSHICR